jgi:hypothetical protein
MKHGAAPAAARLCFATPARCFRHPADRRARRQTRYAGAPSRANEIVQRFSGVDAGEDGIDHMRQRWRATVSMPQPGRLSQPSTRSASPVQSWLRRHCF